MSSNLWVCHRCQLIGTGFEAGRHVDETSHPVEELSAETSAAIRGHWSMGWPTATDWIAFARFKQQVEHTLERSSGP